MLGYFHANAFEDSQSQCRYLIVKDSQSQCRYLINKDSQSQCRYLIVKDSQSQCRYLVVKDSQSQCRYLVDKDSQSQCRYLVAKDSQSQCRYLVDKDSQSQCRYLVVKDSQSQCRYLVAKDSQSQCRYLVVKDSQSQCRYLVVKDSQSQCRYLVVKDSQSQCRYLVDKDSQSQCRYLVAKDSQSQCRDLVAKDSQSQCRYLVDKDSQSQCRYLVVKDSQSQCRYLVAKDSQSQCRYLVVKDSQSQCRYLVNKDSQSQCRHLIVRDSLSQCRHLIVRDSQSQCRYLDSQSQCRYLIAKDSQSQCRYLIDKDSQSQCKYLIDKDSQSQCRYLVVEDSQSQCRYLVAKDSQSQCKYLVFIVNLDYLYLKDNSKTMEAILILMCVSISVLVVDAGAPIVVTTTGRISGFTERVQGVDVKTFLGIPYAEPPVKKWRFRRPKPIKRWGTVLQTRKFASSCYQPVNNFLQGYPEQAGINKFNPNKDFSEDCLYLNIWVPKTKKYQKLTTMVWIHGGGFQSGGTSLDIYNGKYLASSNDVIVVSIGYRLGYLGFIYFGNDMAPGNMGLLDQVVALQWIRNNIERFGGNRNDVTLFGQSAGAASISYHMVSPMSSHLFRRAILLSGTFLGNWAFMEPEVALRDNWMLAERLNCRRNSTNSTIRCMKKLGPENFVSFFPIPPTVDNYFIVKPPHLYLSDAGFTKNKDLMLGLVKDEYTYYLMFDMFNPEVHPNYQFSREEFVNFVPLRTRGILYNGGNAMLLDAILNQYDKALRMPYNGPYVEVLNDLVGDYFFKCIVIPFAQRFNKMITGSESVYMFSFEHRSSNTPFPEWMGVVHGDEIAYQMGLPTDPRYKYSKKEAELSKKMMKYWVNFAKTGKPNGVNPRTNNELQLTSWPVYAKDQENYIIFETKDRFDTANATSQGQWIKSLQWFINGQI
ncbi:hypothetical protein KUTeg_010740 [Tegillarca granosa]|uniref:Carboxylesterase type B domain-containing protein n=1 Tax=Tegillarca granosa TaxID=220873 RepID=A0ABQ9F749_TEGGR|nr:hypothetical protein KUTeg_010740 [Tegillarca granosa]